MSKLFKIPSYSLVMMLFLIVFFNGNNFLTLELKLKIQTVLELV